MRLASARAAFLAIVAHLGCSPMATPEAGQLVLYLDTDAPLPSESSGPSNALTPSPLFDRVRFDVSLDEDGGTASCDCSREFDVFEETVASGAVSFGVLASIAGHGSVRVRLFRSQATVAGEPDPRSTLDATFALPKAPATGVSAQTLLLSTAQLGLRLGVPTPLVPIAGAPSPSHVGTWPRAVRKNCSARPRPGEVCVPGGAFWMGNVAAANFGPEESGNLSRLVVLSPFYMDATEMTVRDYRSTGVGTAFPATGTLGCDLQDYCTFTESPGKYDDLPVNCVQWGEARAACQSQGKDLPTEAQLEYVNSGLGGKPFNWGSDVPECGDAVFGRAGYGGAYQLSDECVPPPPASVDCNGGVPNGGIGVGGPLPPGHGARDKVTIPLPGWTGTLVDLAGNVSELARDDFEPQTGACWDRPGIYTDPLCTVANATMISSRGGDWTSLPASLLAAARNGTSPDAVSPQSGFRCVRASE